MSQLLRPHSSNRASKPSKFGQDVWLLSCQPQIRELHTYSQKFVHLLNEMQPLQALKKLLSVGLSINHLPFGSCLRLLLLSGKLFSCWLFCIEANIIKIILHGDAFGRRRFLTLLCFDVLPTPPPSLLPRDEEGSPKSGGSSGCIKPGVVPHVFFFLSLPWKWQL